MKPSKQAESKLSHLIRAGAVVTNIDGSMYRVTSKFASGEGAQFRLANLQGKAVKTPATFYPISPALARFASWMRLVVAYNKDFDAYVKQGIERAGLPVDPTINWSKWFQATIAPKLMSRDPDVQDEAIHQIIIKALSERGILDASNPHGFAQAINKFPEKTRQLPLARQVTLFLFQAFLWRVAEANRYIKDFVFQDQTDSMWGGEGKEDTDVNLLDTKDNIGGTEAYDEAEADIEVERFRKGFSKFLHHSYREDTAEQYLALFDIIYEEVKASEDAPAPADVYPEWYREVGKKCEHCGGMGWISKDTRTDEEKAKGIRNKGRETCPVCAGKGATEGKSNSWFKVLFQNLPKLIDQYITKHLSSVYQVHPFLEIMRQISRDREAVMASLNDLKLADALDDMDAGGKLVQQYLMPSSSGSGGGGGSLPVGDIGEAAGAAEELAPLAVVATQWEIPKCKGCGGTANVKDCIACKNKFCSDCLINHHANNPSHNRIASKKADAVEDRANARGDAEFRSIDNEMEKYRDIKKIIEDVIGSGLFEDEGNDFYSVRGCEYCGEENTVRLFEGYRNLEEAHAGENEYDFQLCNDCLNKLYYGELQ